MKFFSRTIVFPHPILLVGRVFIILPFAIDLWYLYYAIAENKMLDILSLIVAFLFFVLGMFLYHRLGDDCFGEIVLTNEYVIWRCMFRRRVKLPLSKLKHVDIRTFKVGNVVRSSPYASAFEYVLLSTEPLPNDMLDRIRSGGQLIKFKLTYRACKVLSEQLPTPYCSPFSYKLRTYYGVRNAKKKINSYGQKVIIQSFRTVSPYAFS